MIGGGLEELGPKKQKPSPFSLVLFSNNPLSLQGLKMC